MKKLIPISSLCITVALLLLGCEKKAEDIIGGASSTDPALSATPNPYFDLEWHLKNSGQYNGVTGEDINITPAWNLGYNGSGVYVSIVDDGIQIAHPDLSPNIDLSDSYNYTYVTTDPTAPGSSHGTCVSGLIGARDNDHIGMIGVAPRASLIGLNLIAGSSSNDPELIVDGMIRNSDIVGVSNNSWGFADGYGHYDAPDSTWNDAIVTGLQEGRGGKGTVYIWAAGNGAGDYGYDNSNFDGYANFWGVNSICAVSNLGVRADYSEPGANVLACTPSADYVFGQWIGVLTTDMLGNDGDNSSSTADDLSDKDYTRFFSGTSAAAPIATGVVALMLEANPELSWRDVRIILAITARKNDPGNDDWVTNAAGYHINHNYGFGVIDTGEAVALAKTWTTVGTTSDIKAELWPTSTVQTVNTAIPDNPAEDSPVSNSLTITTSQITAIEFIDIYVQINHLSWGDLEIILVRDDGEHTTESILSEDHTCISRSSSGNTIKCILSSNDHSWVFGSVRHLGESANATWTLEVRDLHSGTTGTFTSWRMAIYGK